MTEALVALGGNVGDVRRTLTRAIARFCRDGVRLVARSADYRTPPWGVTDQPAFVNCAIAVETTLDPRQLLSRALATEAEFGRNRAAEQRWGPRILDIDLLAFDAVEIADPGLVLPHPRMLQRAFVLVPLVEIRPNLVVAGTPIRDALAKLDRSGIEALPPLAP